MSVADVICICQNCTMQWFESELERSEEYYDSLPERVQPGETMPAGECPDCGALCSVMQEEKPIYLGAKYHEHIPPPPVKKSTRFFADKDCVFKQIDKGPGRVTDHLIARCYIDGIGRAQAYKYARLFAAAPRLLDACRNVLARDMGLSDASCDELRALVDELSK